MSSLLAALRPHARLAFSLGGLFMSSAASTSSSAVTGAVSAATRDPTKTKYILRAASPTAQREVPTPLVFVSAGGWDTDSARGMESFAAMFAERGYTCMEIDLAPPQPRPETSEQLLHHFESELRQHIRLAAIPFAPVIVSRGAGTLIAQSFVESNPASGLVLISPPSSNTALAPVSSSSSSPELAPSSSSPLLPTPLPEFTYEPLFPISILGTPAQLDVLRASHRLLAPQPDAPAPAPAPRRGGLLGMFGRGGRGRWEVGVLQADDTQGQEAFVKIEQWLDEIGV